MPQETQKVVFHKKSQISKTVERSNELRTTRGHRFVDVIVGDSDAVLFQSRSQTQLPRVCDVTTIFFEQWSEKTEYLHDLSHESYYRENDFLHRDHQRHENLRLYLLKNLRLEI